MNEQVNSALEPLKQFWAKTSTSVKRLILAVIIISVIVALVFSALLYTKDYVVIFDQLTQAETTEILAKLQEMDASVKVDGNGSILVLKEEESRLRMALATEGYPKSGLSYYLIEQGSGMLTTDYERKQYVNMQLQERIAASIKTLEGVKDAVVTITAPGESVFFLQEKEQPTASVIIHMSPGTVLTNSQVSGIRNLVSKSVSGLSKDNIALSDSQGNDLDANGAGDDVDYTKMGITKEIEDDIRKKIITVLVGPYESDKFKVSVTATVNTDDLITEETIYTPSPDGDNSGVISEQTRDEETSSSTQADGGVPGTSSNSEIPTYPAGGSTGEGSSTSSSESTKYQVSQIKSQFQKSGAIIEDISIGIAIDKASFNPGERESITELVAFAVGVEPEKINVQNFQFFNEEEEIVETGQEETVLSEFLIYIIAGGPLLLLLIGIIIFAILRRKRRRDIEMMERESQQEVTLDDYFGQVEKEPIIPITPVEDVRRQEIKDFAKTNPEIAAQMIKSWIRSDDE